MVHFIQSDVFREFVFLHFPDEVHSAELPSMYQASLICQFLLVAQVIQTTTECLPFVLVSKGCTSFFFFFKFRMMPT